MSHGILTACSTIVYNGHHHLSTINGCWGKKPGQTIIAHIDIWHIRWGCFHSTTVRWTRPCMLCGSTVVASMTEGRVMTTNTWAKCIARLYIHPCMEPAWADGCWFVPCKSMVTLWDRDAHPTAHHVKCCSATTLITSMHHIWHCLFAALFCQHGHTSQQSKSGVCDILVIHSTRMLFR